MAPQEFGGGDKEDVESDREKLGKVGQDHLERFGGNADDHFRFGIQLHRKYARLFAPFYTSDIIVASPIGLRFITKSKGDKGREIDFLSSIEVLVVDQLDYHLMQVTLHHANQSETINFA